MFACYSNSRSFSRRAFSSGVRFFLAIFNLQSGAPILHHIGGLHKFWESLIAYGMPGVMFTGRNVVLDCLRLSL